MGESLLLWKLIVVTPSEDHWRVALGRFPKKEEVVAAWESLSYFGSQPCGLLARCPCKSGPSAFAEEAERVAR